ncbi:MAG: amino acid racemase [Gammaproteobacteria bacterium]|nr:amino acid racemase [Gammaproteobacteria bacterium]
MKIVGVLGGMGPDATVDFMAKVIALTPADKDQDHIHMLVDHNPTVPNRQDAILHGGEDPGPAIAAMARRLEAAGADFLVIPCNTAYVFQSSIFDAVTIPLISIIDETISAIGERNPDVSTVGVLATDGCLKADVYQSALQMAGIRPLLPSQQELRELMDLVGRIKAGHQSSAVSEAMRKLANALVEQGAEAIIAGCTEIPLVLEQTQLGVPLLASTDVLAQKTVQLARGEFPLPNRE